MIILMKKTHELALTPSKATEHSTGYDLTSVEEYRLSPGERKAFRTGLHFDLKHTPENIDVQIRSRSGLAFNHGITVFNAPGTIDRDYTGEIKVILINHSTFPYWVEEGDKIAQLVISSSLVASFFPVKEVEETERGEGGFGSTGR